MKKYIIIVLLLAPLGACKYHTTSDDYFTWTKDFQTKKGVSDNEMKDQDNARFYNMSKLMCGRELSADERAENDNSISEDAGKHFDKGDLVVGGYKYITVDPYTLGVVKKIVGDTIFMTFSEEDPIVFRFVKNNKPNDRGEIVTFYKHLPELEYKEVYVPGDWVTTRVYIPKFRKMCDVRKFVHAHYEKQITGSYVMYEGKKYFFFFIDGIQYVESKLAASRKFTGDTHKTLEGIPVPN